jgi:uncharacterized protein YciI
MFLIEITYIQPLEVVDKYLAAHREFLDECYKKNFLIVSGPKNPRTGGILLSQLTDRKQIEAIIKQDPFHLHEIATYEIKEFSPVKYHKDFANFI